MSLWFGLGSRFSFGLRLFFSGGHKSVRDAFSGFRGCFFGWLFLGFGLGLGLSSRDFDSRHLVLLLRSIFRLGDRILLLLHGFRLHILLLNLLHVSLFLILFHLVVLFVLLMLLGVLNGRMSAVLRHAVSKLLVGSL